MRNSLAVIALLSSFTLVQGQNVPNRTQVEVGGKMPYLRYTLPPGNLNWAPNSVFDQVSYDKNKAAIDAMPRGLASDLRLVGAHAYNEYMGQVAPEVILSDKAVIIYERTAQGIVPRYLADCRYKGKPWANRIKLVETALVTQAVAIPIPQVPPQQVQAQPPPQVVVPGMNNSNTVTAPGFPGRIDLNLNVVGLPQTLPPQVVPAGTNQNITYTYVVKRDWAAKFKDVGFGVMGAGVGTGVAAAGILGPAAYENAARAKANSAIDVARINGDASVAAAKNRVPDSFTITSSSAPVLTGGAQTALLTGGNQSQQASPSAIASPSQSTTNNTQGGSVGSVAGGTVSPGAVQVAGSTATATNGSVTTGPVTVKAEGGKASSDAEGGSVKDSGNSKSESAGGSSTSYGGIANAKVGDVAGGSSKVTIDNKDINNNDNLNKNINDNKNANENQNSNANDNNNTADAGSPPSHDNGGGYGH